MILQNILKYRNGSNFAHTLLSTIKSSGVNPPEKFFFYHVNLQSLYSQKKMFNKIPKVGILWRYSKYRGPKCKELVTPKI